jgi:transcription antitermination protein NusB
MLERRKARESALQSLFQSEFEHTLPKSHMGAKPLEPTEESRLYASLLVDGVRTNLQTIDQTIQSNSHNWKVQRMALVDKNILRIAIFEMIHSAEPVPVKDCINEAVELAKKFGSNDSSSFINGILDQIAKTHPERTQSNP